MAHFTSIKVSACLALAAFNSESRLSKLSTLTANGYPHIGHGLTRVIKDMIPRYRTMKGYKVLRKAGWDTHGLPVELEVEKKLGLDGKDQIEEYGLDLVIMHCKECVW